MALTPLKKISSPIVIAIDGPAGAGKSTVAKELARRLGFAYLDTGAMYRALTLKAIEERKDLENEDEIVAMAHRTVIDLKMNHEKQLRVFLDGQDVTQDIRSEKVTNNTFHIARAPGVREIMVGWQRKIGSQTNIVVEGRDIGTVVFPKATRKFYLDADFAERSRRRIEELRQKGKAVNESQLKNELQERDHKDFTRETGPLRKAQDAVSIDSTRMTIDDTVDAILKYIPSYA